jgi:hypothetical protein
MMKLGRESLRQSQRNGGPSLEENCKISFDYLGGFCKLFQIPLSPKGIQEISLQSFDNLGVANEILEDRVSPSRVSLSYCRKTSGLLSEIRNLSMVQKFQKGNVESILPAVGQGPCFAPKISTFILRSAAKSPEIPCKISARIRK